MRPQLACLRLSHKRLDAAALAHYVACVRWLITHDGLVTMDRLDAWVIGMVEQYGKTSRTFGRFLPASARARRRRGR